jgi:multiple sugar transport system permease protein
MVIISFSKNLNFLYGQNSFVFTLKNYREILADPSLHLLIYLKNSLVVSSVAAIISTFFAALSAYAITRLKFPGKLLIPFFLLAVSMFPQISIVGNLFKIMIHLNLINTQGALILPYITLGMPLALWIMMSYFSQLPVELDYAAMIDGARRLQILRKIIFPLALPGIIATSLLVFIHSFNEFLFALILTTDYHARTIPVGIALFEGLHGEIPWGQIMASAVIAILPTILLTVIFQKYIVQGLTKGAVKG